MDIDKVKSFLGEGFHTAFRKATDAPGAHDIWKAIQKLPEDEWDAVLGFVAEPLVEFIKWELEADADPPDLVVEVTADTSKFQEAMKEAEYQTTRFALALANRRIDHLKTGIRGALVHIGEALETFTGSRSLLEARRVLRSALELKVEEVTTDD